jgi:hypothetical protein
VVVPVIIREETRSTESVYSTAPTAPCCPNFYTCTADFKADFQTACTPIKTAAMGPETDSQRHLIVKLPLMPAAVRSSQRPLSGAAMSRNLQERANGLATSKRPLPDSASAEGGTVQVTKSAVSYIQRRAYMPS